MCSGHLIQWVLVIRWTGISSGCGAPICFVCNVHVQNLTALHLALVLEVLTEAKLPLCGFQILTLNFVN